MGKTGGQVAYKSTGGRAPRKQLATKAARKYAPARFFHVENGELKKLKFPADEMDTQESQTLCLANTMDDENDKDDKNDNPCRVSIFHESGTLFNRKPF